MVPRTLWTHEPTAHTVRWLAAVGSKASTPPLARDHGLWTGGAAAAHARAHAPAAAVAVAAAARARHLGRLASPPATAHVALGFRKAAGPGGGGRKAGGARWSPGVILVCRADRPGVDLSRRGGRRTVSRLKASSGAVHRTKQLIAREQLLD
jgi:hypothetical protein